MIDVDRAPETISHSARVKHSKALVSQARHA
jgi:hypothetical protein